jgi:transcriptional regulator with PAS, ATPase and Fis domain
MMIAANLGIVQAKCGSYKEAENNFRTALRLLNKCCTVDKTFPEDLYIFIKYEAALFYTDTGRYHVARRILERSKHTEASTTWTEMVSAITGCALWLRLGNVKKFRELRGKATQNPLLNNPFFKIDLEMLDLSFSPPPPTKMSESLLRLRGMARESGLRHQQCQISEMLARTLALDNQLSEAQRYADEALRIANRNGYKPLEARAMISRGLASDVPRDRELWFQKAYKAGQDLGMPEIVAESAYRLGACMLELGNTALARDYLLRSTVITSGLAEQLSIGYRSRYLDEAWRKDARQLLRVCARTATGATYRPQGKDPAEDLFFRALYRISIAASDSTELEAFMASTATALEKLPSQEAVAIMLRRPETTLWKTGKAGITDDLKSQISSLADTTRTSAQFHIHSKEAARNAITWIPIDARNALGGIYLLRSNKAPPVTEREIEFASMLGTLVSGAVDRIIAQPKPAPQKVESRETTTFGIVGNSRAIRDVISQIQLAGSNTASTLIEGETGAGKELVARAIHMAGDRARGPFVAVDCGALPESLIESELFGAARGAYTGAVTDRPGLFEGAHRGTLFLDEISNMPPSLQVKLLRVLQEREVRRIGDTKIRAVDVRLIAATNRSLHALVEDGTFRQDLLYRINVLHITLPPLRERRGDIPLLAHHFLDALNKKHKTRKHIAPEALESLAAHRFPGNIRELQNMMERAFFSAPSATITSILPKAVLTEGPRELPTDEALDAWFRDLTEGRRDFWTNVHDRYRRRDISRETIVALFDLGLRKTRGSYRKLASMFRLEPADYRRMMDFLRRSNCLLDFRPYRKAATAP